MATPEDLSAAMVEGTLNNFDAPPAQAPLGGFADTAQHIPGIAASMGYTAFRGSNTILGGGWDAKRPGTATIRGSVRYNNPLNPSTWGRYGSQDIFFNKPGRYTPFNTADLGNMAARGVGGRGWMGPRVKRMVDEGEEVFTRGFNSRITAAARVGRMSSSQLGAASGLSEFLGRSGFTRSMTQAPLTAGQSAQALLGTSTGIGGRVSGFISGARYGAFDPRVQSGVTSAARAGNARALQYADDLAKAGFKVGNRYGLRAGASLIGTAAKMSPTLGGKAAVMLGARASLAMSGVGMPLLAAWGAYDLAKLATTATGHMIKGTIRTGLDAIQSYAGGMRTGIMETGFKDNEATMTSRARGVMAIQNSRLNARSVLGNEAGAMAAHFG